MQSMGDAHIPVRVLDLVEAPQSDYPVSSTVIRGLIAKGEMQEAMTLLGRPFELRAEVVSDEKKFSSITELVDAMKVDKKKVLLHFSAHT